MSFLQINDVSYEYTGGFLALDRINLHIEQGENLAIVGQNGAGKTTLVKMLNGLLRPTQGSVMIGEFNTKEHTTAKLSRIVGYVFQNPDDQIFHSTVRAEVAYGLKSRGLTQEEISHRVDEALKIAGIHEFAEENPFNLSFSMRKFIAIAAVIAVDCPVLIFDEPTAGQDLNGNKKLAEMLIWLKEKGKTLITISHDMEFVAKNFDHIVVMANKKILGSGTSKEIFWNAEMLNQAMLKQPYISRLFQSLDLKSDIVTIEEGANDLLKRLKIEV